MTELVEIQPVIDAISLTLQTTFESDEKNGSSLLLIAKPETAKTSSIFKFNNLDFVSYYDEITAKKLLEEFLPLCKEHRRTLLVPDLINCVEKQKATREQFLAIIKSGIDDTGVMRISTQYKQLQMMKLAEGLKFNMITAVTVENFKMVKKYLEQTGLLSRFIPFSYDYTLDTLRKILDVIEKGVSTKSVTIPKLIKKDFEIENSPDLFKQFEILATNIGRFYSGYGIRALVNLQRLAKANAILNKRKEIIKEDIDKIFALSKHINFDFNAI